MFLNPEQDSTPTMSDMIGLIFCIIFMTSIPLDPYYSSMEKQRTNSACLLNAGHSKLTIREIAVGSSAFLGSCAEQGQLQTALRPGSTHASAISEKRMSYSPQSHASDLESSPLQGHRFVREDGPLCFTPSLR